jgi:protoporphyrinogen oxidase
VIILGGGLCGLTAALTLEQAGVPWLLLEASDRPGGAARSRHRDGHTFDVTGHWLHLRDPGIRALAETLLGDRWLHVARRSVIFSHGALTRYPFQVNLHGLPAEVVFECLRGFLDRRAGAPRRRPRTFEDYVLRHFGAGIARHFMIPYNARLWGVHPRELTSAWCQRFVPVPDRDQVLRGALGAATPELGYNVSFQYPREGGIEPFSRALHAALPPDRVHLRAPVERVDLRRRRVRVGDAWLGYAALIATGPLPDLCRAVAEPPAALVAAADRLRATAVRYLDLALRRRGPADFHWVYVPEAEHLAYRLGIYSNAAPAMAPPGGASLYVELADRAPRATDDVVRGLIPLLTATGALGDPADVAFAETQVVDPAYVVFDAHHAASRRRIVRHLEARDVFPRGRYGSWDYGSMEDAMIQGREVAQRLGERYKRQPHDS